MNRKIAALLVSPVLGAGLLTLIPAGAASAEDLTCGVAVANFNGTFDAQGSTDAYVFDGNGGLKVGDDTGTYKAANTGMIATWTSSKSDSGGTVTISHTLTTDFRACDNGLADLAAVSAFGGVAVSLASNAGGLSVSDAVTAYKR